MMSAKWWDDRSGYGAIASIKTAPWDIWCSFACIEAKGYRSLDEGEPVDVAYVRRDQDSFKYVATRVRPLTRAE